MDTDKCTDAIGLSPTKIWRQRHERIDLAHPEIPNTNWLIKLEDRALYSTDDGLAELFEIIWPARERIKSFLCLSGLKGEFASVVTMYEDRPLWQLKPATFTKLAWFGCEWTMDIFDHRK